MEYIVVLIDRNSFIYILLEYIIAYTVHIYDQWPRLNVISFQYYTIACCILTSSYSHMSHTLHRLNHQKHSLKLTWQRTWKWMVGKDDPFLLGPSLFSGENHGVQWCDWRVEVWYLFGFQVRASPEGLGRVEPSYTPVPGAGDDEMGKCVAKHKNISKQQNMKVFFGG